MWSGPRTCSRTFRQSRRRCRATTSRLVEQPMSIEVNAQHESPQAGAMVARVRGVSLRYGKTLALDGVDLDIPAGCMAGFIGPDGVGKSSLFSLIAGARAIQSGTVLVL